MRPIHIFPIFSSSALKLRQAKSTINFRFQFFASKKNRVPRPSTSLAVTQKESNLVSIPEEEIKNPWIKAHDPAGSGLVYWWNPKSRESTALGAPRPTHWVEVRDPSKETSLTYWWDPETNRTTSLGAPRPDSLEFSRTNQPRGPILGHLGQPANSGYSNPPPQTLGQSMKAYFWIGVSMTLGILFVRILFGI